MKKQSGNAHIKKMIAPIAITVIIIIYYAVWGALLVGTIENTVMKIISGVVPALILAAMVAVCIQRIKEIKGGEEDDLGKY